MKVDDGTVVGVEDGGGEHPVVARADNEVYARLAQPITDRGVARNDVASEATHREGLGPDAVLGRDVQRTRAWSIAEHQVDAERRL